MSIGEPQHAPPRVHCAGAARGPGRSRQLPFDRRNSSNCARRPRAGSSAASACRRALSIRESMVLPVSGTREGLFSFVQTAIDARKRAARRDAESLLSDLRRRRVPRRRRTAFHRRRRPNPRYLPDLDTVSADVWKRCQLLFLCTPGNPSGAVMSVEYLQPRARACRSLRIRRRVRRMLCGYLSRRSRSRHRASSLHALASGRDRCAGLRRVSQPLEALERSGTALGLRRGRSRAHQGLSAVSHLSRLRRAAADAAREHCPPGTTTHIPSPTAASTVRNSTACCPILEPVLQVTRPDRGVLSLAGRRWRRRTLRARSLRPQESHHPAGLVPRARRGRRQSRTRTGAHFVGGRRRRMRRSGPAASAISSREHS